LFALHVFEFFDEFEELAAAAGGDVSELDADTAVRLDHAHAGHDAELEAVGFEFNFEPLAEGDAEGPVEVEVGAVGAEVEDAAVIAGLNHEDANRGWSVAGEAGIAAAFFLSGHRQLCDQLARVSAQDPPERTPALVDQRPEGLAGLIGGRARELRGIVALAEPIKSQVST
jgi:hypothetical protein